MVDLNKVRLFIKVVELGSFINVARQQNIPSTTVSRKIQKLEENLQARLLNRSTRKLTLTEQGRIFYEYANEHIAKLDEAIEKVSESQTKLTGLLRIAAPIDFCILFLQPIINEFMSIYPDIKIEMNVSDELVDLIESRIDVAFRTGTLKDSNLIAKRLSKSHVICCASHDYIKKHTRPKSPEELEKHNCVVMGNTLNKQQWHFKKGGTTKKVSVTGRYAVNSMTLMIESVLSGIGIALVPQALVQKHINDGKLEILLPSYVLPSGDLFALYQSHRYLPKTAHLFIEYVTTEMKRRYDVE